MSAELHLEHVCLFSLCQGNHEEELGGQHWYSKPRYCFTGSEAVVAGLRDLAQNAKFRPVEERYDSDDDEAENGD